MTPEYLLKFVIMKKPILLILFTLLITNVFSQCADTSNIFEFTFNGKNYEVVKELKSWDAAAACAVERGGYLVEINDQAEQDAVYDAIINGAGVSPTYISISNGGGIAYVWIGATDKDVEGTWLWDGDNDNAGINFWDGEGAAGAGNGTPVGGAYNNWGGSSTGTIKEPDNWGTGQNQAAIGLAGWPSGTTILGIPGEWNDINGTNAIYYVIEYDNTNIGYKTFLQGAYQSASMMEKTLNVFLPNNQPYNTAPWDYNGNESINPIPVDMVDWVLVELRDPNDPTLIISRRAAVLLDNGNVVDTNLATQINFPNISPGSYYLCIYHRNHFPVMSAGSVNIPATALYDFSDTLSFPPYGGGSVALIELESDIFGMIGGDVNKDGTIKYSGPNNDRGFVLQYIVNQTGSTSITNTVSGYRGEDINMDNIIKYSGPFNDPSLIIQNLVGLTGSTSITSVYNSVVPEAHPPFQCGDNFVDQRDGQDYSTVQIGSQCWMAENLAYLPSVSPSSSGSDTTPYYYVYDYQGTDVAVAMLTTNYQTYGALYNWPAVMDGAASSSSVPSGVQGICPTGWHVPSDEEWKILEGEVDSLYDYPDPVWDGWSWRGTDAGGNLKETGTIYWDPPNTAATNSSGFTALPAGFRVLDGTFLNTRLLTYLWSSTVSFDSYIWFRRMDYNDPNVMRGAYEKVGGLSVRCIKDCNPFPTQSDAGEDSLNITGNSIILNANTPVDGQGLWTIATGNGGFFADSTSPTSTFNGMSDSTYQLVWTISNNCGSSSDTVVINFAPHAPFPNCGILTDARDGHAYNTVIIGNQCWMAENLAYLPEVYPADSTSDTIPYYYVYDYNGTNVANAKATTNIQTYGVLYNWPAAMAGEASSNSFPSGVQGICPEGSHLPSDEEWKILEGEVDSMYNYPDPVWNIWDWRGTDVGGNLKETDTIHWASPNTAATNSSGFTALPGGFRDIDSTFNSLKLLNYFWTTTVAGGYYVWFRRMDYNDPGVMRGAYEMNGGFSVRCIKDCVPLPTQPDAGPDSLYIIGDSITLMGNSPVNDQGIWTIEVGVGGSFSDSTSPTSVFYGVSGNTYLLVWTISNICGTSSSTVLISFTSQGFSCGDTLVDTRDGNSYATVEIGPQCWMARNLAYLPSVSPADSGSYTSPYYYVYDYQGTDVAVAKSTNNYQTYGVLYNWPAVLNGEAGSNTVPSGVKGVCPDDWHLSSDEEWKIFEGFVDSQYEYPDPEWEIWNWRGSDAGGNLKEIDTTHWTAPNTGATNISNYTALPGGYKSYENIFEGIGNHAQFWTSTEGLSSLQWSWHRLLNFDEAKIWRGQHHRNSGFSVRCIKN